jgi:hypothetical protein
VEHDLRAVLYRGETSFRRAHPASRNDIGDAS